MSYSRVMEIIMLFLIFILGRIFIYFYFLIFILGMIYLFLFFDIHIRYDIYLFLFFDIHIRYDICSFLYSLYSYNIQLLTFNEVYSRLYGPGQWLIDRGQRPRLINHWPGSMLKFWNMIKILISYEIFENFEIFWKF
jgi:hypothetical protein